MFSLIVWQYPPDAAGNRGDPAGDKYAAQQRRLLLGAARLVVYCRVCFRPGNRVLPVVLRLQRWLFDSARV